MVASEIPADGRDAEVGARRVVVREIVRERPEIAVIRVVHLPPAATVEVQHLQRRVAELHLALGDALAERDELAGEARRLRALRCRPRPPAVLAPGWLLPLLGLLGWLAGALRGWGR